MADQQEESERITRRELFKRTWEKAGFVTAWATFAAVLEACVEEGGKALIWNGELTVPPNVNIRKFSRTVNSPIVSGAGKHSDIRLKNPFVVSDEDIRVSLGFPSEKIPYDLKIGKYYSQLWVAIPPQKGIEKGGFASFYHTMDREGDFAQGALVKDEKSVTKGIKTEKGDLITTGK